MSASPATVTTYRNGRPSSLPPEAIRHEGMTGCSWTFAQAPGASVMGATGQDRTLHAGGRGVFNCSQVSFACRHRPTDSWQA